MIHKLITYLDGSTGNPARFFFLLLIHRKIMGKSSRFYDSLTYLPFYTVWLYGIYTDISWIKSIGRSQWTGQQEIRLDIFFSSKEYWNKQQFIWLTHLWTLFHCALKLVLYGHFLEKIQWLKSLDGSARKPVRFFLPLDITSDLTVAFCFPKNVHKNQNQHTVYPPLLSFFSAPAIACTMPQFRGKKCHFLPRATKLYITQVL